ncbi:MAG: metalloregulator ArsR/SmtB family transcription factor [Phycisphaerales bacterium]
MAVVRLHDHEVFGQGLTYKQLRIYLNRDQSDGPRQPVCSDRRSHARAILDTLRDGERSVNEIRESLGRAVARLSQPAFSQHLAVLRRAGLVKTRRHGRRILYAFHPQPLTEVVDWIAAYDRFWTAKLDNLGQYLDAKHGRSAPSPNAAPQTRSTDET